MCDLAGVSRASYYRHWVEVEPDEADMALRAAIQEIALEHHRRYGYRRVTAELRRRGLIVNHKRVLRMLRKDQLLAVRFRKYILTTDSQHDYQVHLNLAGRMTVSGVNQLWIADITYIRLRLEFVFLAIVLDRYSRKAIGWALDRSLTARVAVTALEEAIERRQPPAGVVHHSDRGTQYASAEYTAVLRANRMTPSMSRPANPYDNAACESFMKTLKQEEIYCHQYRDFAELSEHIEEFIDQYYNRQRLHSALGYRTPEEFERDAAGAVTDGGNCGTATMKFFNPPKPAVPVPGPSPRKDTDFPDGTPAHSDGVDRSEATHGSFRVKP
jgi:putative transposase